MKTKKDARRPQLHLVSLINKLIKRQLYVVFMTPTQKWSNGTDALLAAGLQEHLLYLRKLQRRKALLMAGPFAGDTGPWKGGGMMILRASSLAAARAMARAEPFQKRGLRKNEVRGWQFNAGALARAV